MGVSSLDRYWGAMVGTLCGDALGAPYEWKSSTEVEQDLKKRGGIVPREYAPFDYIDPWGKERIVLKGHPTDDSELTAALGLSLVSTLRFNPVDVYDRLRDFIHGRKSILSDVAYGTGGTLRAALMPGTYKESVAKFETNEIPTPPSNGSLMRNIPVALRAYPDFGHVIRLAAQQSVITHRNLSSVAACVAHAVFVGVLISGVSPKDAWSETIGKLKKCPANVDPVTLNEILAVAITKPDYATEIKGKEGWAVLSLRVALWATISATDFADGILRAISVGGDTDTYAAIAGGALGVHFGFSGIPTEWVNVLQGKDTMCAIADRLHAYWHRP